MSNDPVKADGMETLIAALLDGDLSAHEIERLRDLLARNPAYRAEYLRQASVKRCSCGAREQHLLWGWGKSIPASWPSYWTKWL